MKNKKIKRILEIFIFCLILMSAIIVASSLLVDKSSIYKNKEFFEQDNNFDVLLFGSSHMEIFVNPMELWKNYGIVSYNLGCPEESVPISYWSMRNAISVHKPKVIVYDVIMFNMQTSYTDDEHLHYALDAYPLSKTKLNAINDVLKERNTKIEMIFPIANYHNRWKTMGKESFCSTETFIKGNLSYGFWHTMDVNPYNQFPFSNKAAEVDENSQDYVYLQKIIDMCKENDIQLLLVANPFSCQEYKQENVHAVEKIAKDKNIPFINFIDMDSIIDMNVDLYDGDHVNQSGLHKVTNYLGSYLSKNYDIVDHRTEDEYSFWNDDYEKYKQLKLESLWWIVDDLDIVLEMLHDTDYKSYVYIGKDTKVSMDETLFEELLQNIGRNNLDVYSNKSLKSSDIKVLNDIGDSLHKKDYLAIYTPNGHDRFNVEEYTDYDAYSKINELCQDIGTYEDKSKEVTNSDIIIAVIDSTNNAVKLIRRYDEDGVNHEDLFSDVNREYFK